MGISLGWTRNTWSTAPLFSLLSTHNQYRQRARVISLFEISYIALLINNHYFSLTRPNMKFGSPLVERKSSINIASSNHKRSCSRIIYMTNFSDAKSCGVLNFIHACATHPISGINFCDRVDIPLLPFCRR